MPNEKSVWPFLWGGLAAALLPSPTDFLHFWLQNYLYTHQLTKHMFTLLQLVDWYLVDTLWWVFLIIIAAVLHVKKTKTLTKIAVIATMIGIGAVIGIIGRFLTL